MEIEVGEYVRDEKGLFGKCKSKYIDSVRLDFQDGTIIATIDHTGYKHSKNIIDLIEVEDIIKLKISGIYMKIVIADDRILANLREKLEKYNTEDFEIIEVLTHEQYEKNSYKLEE